MPAACVGKVSAHQCNVRFEKNGILERYETKSINSSQYPGERMFIYSMSTAVLDLVQIILKQQGTLEGLDSAVVKRTKVILQSVKEQLPKYLRL